LRRFVEPTSLERKVMEVLDSLGIPYIFQYSTRTGFVIDFAVFVNGRKIALEVDGPCHDSRKRRKRDAFRDYMLVESRNR